MQRNFFLIFLSGVFSLFSLLFAQTAKMSIDGKPQKSPNEFVSASVRDDNGRICAMIKVISDMDGFKYQANNGVVKVDDNPGEDLVYLQPDERVLRIYHTGFEPLQIILSDYGIQLHSKEVWIIKISGENKMNRLPVVIITRPEGARVFIDGKDKGVTEKHTLNRGAHNIRLVKQGYEPIVQTIQVDKNNTLFKYNLKKIEDVPLQITSVPSGAIVFIDNVKFGATPLSDFYPSGKYPIRIEKDWYVTYEDFIEIKAPDTQKEYTLPVDFGSLTVTSEPQSGLDIYVNGKSINSQTPKTIKRLRPGTYRITAKSKYYETKEQTVDVKRGAKKKIVLASESNFALLNINTLPGAIIYLNNKKITKLKNIRLEPSVVWVRAEMPPKGKAVKKLIVLKKNENITVDIKPQIATGNILVAVLPFDAAITLKGDAGEFYTSYKSKAFKNIPAGTYILTVKRKGYNSQTIKLVLADNKTIKRNVRLTAVVSQKPSLAAENKSGGIFFKSMIVPGWGQMSSGRRGGWSYTIAALGAAGWYYNAWSAHSKNMDAYNRAKNVFESNQTRSNAFAVNKTVKKADESYKKGMTALYVLGGIYALNLLDALISSSKTQKKSYSLKPYINNRTFAYEKQPMLGIVLTW